MSRAKMHMLQHPRSRDVLALGLITAILVKNVFHDLPFPPKVSLMRCHSVHNVTSTFNALIYVSVFGDTPLLRGYLANRQLSRQLLINPSSHLDISSRGLLMWVK